jgi:Tol biopolymer transport system component
MNADGTGARKIAAGCYPGAWGPGDAWLGVNCNGKLTVLSLDGSRRRRLALGWAETWSPDGRRLLVSVPDNGVLRLDTIDPAGGARRTIMRFPTWSTEFTAAWSPDGTQIAYAGSSNRPNDLFVVRADGTHRRQLTHSGDIGEPGWLR